MSIGARSRNAAQLAKATSSQSVTGPVHFCSHPDAQSWEAYVKSKMNFEALNMPGSYISYSPSLPTTVRSSHAAVSVTQPVMWVMGDVSLPKPLHVAICAHLCVWLHPPLIIEPDKPGQVRRYFQLAAAVKWIK